MSPDMSFWLRWEAGPPPGPPAAHQLARLATRMVPPRNMFRLGRPWSAWFGGQTQLAEAMGSWGLAHCTPRHSGQLRLAESPGVFRALIFKNLDVTKNNWKCVLVLLPLFLPTLPALSIPCPGAAAFCPMQERAPPLPQRSFVQALQGLRCFQMCEIQAIYTILARTPIQLACYLQILASLSVLLCVMTCNSVFYMQVVHFCVHHQSYTMQARIRRSLAVSILIISGFSKGAFSNLFLQREIHWH